MINSYIFEMGRRFRSRKSIIMSEKYNRFDTKIKLTLMLTLLHIKHADQSEANILKRANLLGKKIYFRKC